MYERIDKEQSRVSKTLAEQQRFIYFRRWENSLSEGKDKDMAPLFGCEKEANITKRWSESETNRGALPAQTAAALSKRHIRVQRPEPSDILTSLPLQEHQYSMLIKMFSSIYILA